MPSQDSVRKTLYLEQEGNSLILSYFSHVTSGTFYVDFMGGCSFSFGVKGGG